MAARPRGVHHATPGSTGGGQGRELECGVAELLDQQCAGAVAGEGAGAEAERTDVGRNGCVGREGNHLFVAGEPAEALAEHATREQHLRVEALRAGQLAGAGGERGCRLRMPGEVVQDAGKVDRLAGAFQPGRAGAEEVLRAGEGRRDFTGARFPEQGRVAGTGHRDGLADDSGARRPGRCGHERGGCLLQIARKADRVLLDQSGDLVAGSAGSARQQRELGLDELLLRSPEDGGRGVEQTGHVAERAAGQHVLRERDGGARRARQHSQVAALSFEDLRGRRIDTSVDVHIPDDVDRPQVAQQGVEAGVEQPGAAFGSLGERHHRGVPQGGGRRGDGGLSWCSETVEVADFGAEQTEELSIERVGAFHPVHGVRCSAPFGCGDRLGEEHAVVLHRRIAHRVVAHEARRELPCQPGRPDVRPADLLDERPPPLRGSLDGRRADDVDDRGVGLVASSGEGNELLRRRGR